MKILFITLTGTWGLLCSAARADEVRLASGGTVSGIVRQESDMVIVEVTAGMVSVPASQVVEIERKRHALHDYYERYGPLERSSDPKALYELASWAAQKGLPRFAVELSARVLKLDREHEGAHKLLGHELREGRWMTAEESKTANGQVFFRGRWMAGAERDRLLKDEEDARQAALDRYEQRKREEEERRKAAASKNPGQQETLVMGIGGRGEESYHRSSRYYSGSRSGRGRRGIRGLLHRPGSTIPRSAGR